jgi:hypothetical protein
MKPPNCAICGKDCESGKLIYFKLRPSDKVWHKKMKKIHGVGHPPEAAWFCVDHCENASKLSSLTISEAMEELKKSKK